MGDNHCPDSVSGGPGGPPLCVPLGEASPAESPGELNHVGWLAEHIGRLYLQPDYSDLTLVVEGTRLPAHRLVLASCSDYFRAMLYGGMRESQQNEVVLMDTPLGAFELLLKYIYTGQLKLSGLKVGSLLSLVATAFLLDQK